MGAVPIDLVEAVRSPKGGPATSGEESPFGAPGATRGDLASEAAALAAEAAAVRALDSGPLTPPPEFFSAEISSNVAALQKEQAAVTPPPAVVAPEPEPDTFDTQPTPPPKVTARQLTPPPEQNGVGATPAPEVRAMRQTPLPDIAAVLRGTPAPEIVAGLPTPPPDVTHSQPVVPADGTSADTVDDTGALPTSPMSNDGAGATPEGPVGVAAPTEISSHDTIGDGEEDADEHLEVVDAIDGIGGRPTSEVEDGRARSTPPPRPLRTRTPPPIPRPPKTPGPEPVSASAPPPSTSPPPSTPTPSVPSPEEGASQLLPPGLPILPEALAQRPRRPKRSKPWFEEVFDEDYLRTLPFMRADQTLREVEFISEVLNLSPGAEVLDVACGYGRHAIELVQRGYNVTGLDLSLPLLIRAADEAQRRALSVNFVHADMREMAFERQFDGAYSMLTSFGYFDEETNLRVAERIGRALKPGARFLLDVVNRDYMIADLPARVWWEGTGCVVLEEVDFNFHTSRLVTHRSIVFEDGRQVEQEISVRAYSLHEIGRLLRQAGFRVIDVSGSLATRSQFFGTSSRNLLVVAEKREEDVT